MIEKIFFIISLVSGQCAGIIPVTAHFIRQNASLCKIEYDSLFIILRRVSFSGFHHILFRVVRLLTQQFIEKMIHVAVTLKRAFCDMEQFAEGLIIKPVFRLELVVFLLPLCRMTSRHIVTLQREEYMHHLLLLFKQLLLLVKQSLFQLNALQSALLQPFKVCRVLIVVTPYLQSPRPLQSSFRGQSR